MPIYVSLTLNTVSKVMTLNGLNNGYKPDPSSHYGNPMAVTPVIAGPVDSGDTPTEVQIITANGSNFQGWENNISYNLPDGGILVITIGLKCNTKYPSSIDDYALTYNSQVSATSYIVSVENTSHTYNESTNIPTYSISIVIDTKASS